MSRKFQRTIEDFTCEQCNLKVEGNGFTNHCPQCLWSKHVDVNPGDRKAVCEGMMQPIEIEVKTSGGFDAARILHSCTKCDHKRWNKVSKEDDRERLLTL